MQMRKAGIFAEKQKSGSVGKLDRVGLPTAPTLGTKCDGPLLLLFLT